MKRWCFALTSTFRFISDRLCRDYSGIWVEQISNEDSDAKRLKLKHAKDSKVYRQKYVFVDIYLKSSFDIWYFLVFVVSRSNQLFDRLKPFVKPNATTKAEILEQTIDILQSRCACNAVLFVSILDALVSQIIARSKYPNCRVASRADSSILCASGVFERLSDCELQHYFSAGQLAFGFTIFGRVNHWCYLCRRWGISLQIVPFSIAILWVYFLHLMFKSSRRFTKWVVYSSAPTIVCLKFHSSVFSLLSPWWSHTQSDQWKMCGFNTCIRHLWAFSSPCGPPT